MTTLLLFGGQSSGMEEYDNGINGGVPIEFYDTLLADTWLYDTVRSKIDPLGSIFFRNCVYWFIVAPVWYVISVQSRMV